MQIEQQIIGAAELGKILGMKKEAIRTALWRIKHGRAEPNIIPPHMALPGHTRWHIEDVQAWINKARRETIEQEEVQQGQQEEKRTSKRVSNTELPDVNLI